MKLVALVIAMALPALAYADKAGSAAAKLEGDDVQLVSHIHAVDMMQIDLGKMAEKQGTPAIKKYATTMVKDHQDFDKNLTAFAKLKGVATIPADVPATEAAKQEQNDLKMKVDELKKLKGPEFDRQYLAMMVSAHDTELGRLDAALPNIKDPELMQKMKDLRVVLQTHADTARDLQKSAPSASTGKAGDGPPTKR